MLVLYVHKEEDKIRFSWGMNIGTVSSTASFMDGSVQKFCDKYNGVLPCWDVTCGLGSLICRTVHNFNSSWEQVHSCFSKKERSYASAHQILNLTRSLSSKLKTKGKFSEPHTLPLWPIHISIHAKCCAITEYKALEVIITLVHVL